MLLRAARLAAVYIYLFKVKKRESPRSKVFSDVEYEQTASEIDSNDSTLASSIESKKSPHLIASPGKIQRAVLCSMSALFSPAPSRIFISYSRNFNFIKGNWGEVEAKTRGEEKRNSRARHRTRELCSDSIFIEQTSSECEQRKNTMTSSFFSVSTWIVKWAVTHFPKLLCFFFFIETLTLSSTWMTFVQCERWTLSAKLIACPTLTFTPHSSHGWFCDSLVRNSNLNERRLSRLNKSTFFHSLSMFVVPSHNITTHRWYIKSMRRRERRERRGVLKISGGKM